ncbi:MAG: 50S ribosomal protein L18 [Candidatus Helarchaeota archaeon]|nr:50S ribosomal protein L18 [Candidatus Helarchaeota archaeon]
MANGPRYHVKFRRRREGKTDYYYRKRLLMSEIPRLVIRKSLRHISIQLIEAKLGGDKVQISAHSKELLKDFGWKFGCGSIPAAYLTGLLAGYKIIKSGIDKSILDIGVYRPIKKTRLFAALKGALDSGLEIPYSEDILPDEEHIKGSHILKYAELLESENPDIYNKQFSKYLKLKLDPKKIVENFVTTKENIIKKYS